MSIVTEFAEFNNLFCVTNHISSLKYLTSKACMDHS